MNEEAAALSEGEGMSENENFLTDTLMMLSDIFDYLNAHPESERESRRNALVAQLQDADLDDD